MMRPLALFVIGLLLGGGIGFTLSSGTVIPTTVHDHSDPAQHGPGTAHAAHEIATGHAHGAPLVLPAAEAPWIMAHLIPDPVSGVNLHVMTQRFRFAPERSGGAHVDREGHAHVYVNGIKIARLYGPWMHLSDLPSGAEVTVTLNTNDHRDILAGDTLVATTVVVP